MSQVTVNLSKKLLFNHFWKLRTKLLTLESSASVDGQTLNVASPGSLSFAYSLPFTMENCTNCEKKIHFEKFDFFCSFTLYSNTNAKTFPRFLLTVDVQSACF